jgi:hypothetical protein
MEEIISRLYLIWWQEGNISSRNYFSALTGFPLKEADRPKKDIYFFRCKKVEQTFFIYSDRIMLISILCFSDQPLCVSVWLSTEWLHSMWCFIYNDDSSVIIPSSSLLFSHPRRYKSQNSSSGKKNHKQLCSMYQR